MNAATRAQAAGILARLLDPARAPRPGTLTRARRVLEAAKRRPAGRLPARMTHRLEAECYDCGHFGAECMDTEPAAPACPHFTPAEMEDPDPCGTCGYACQYPGVLAVDCPNTSPAARADFWRYR